MSLIFDLLARDNASRAFNNAGNAAEQSSRRISGAIKVAAGAIAAFGVGDFLVKSVASLARIERINAQTAAVIESTGQAAGVTAQHIFDMTGALENLTATEAESIQQGANLLLTFTNVKNGVGENADIFDQAVVAMNDMARALDTTGSANLDMSSTATRLGKALNDPIAGISALSRVGVTFTSDQKDMIRAMVEAGDVAGAQAMILQELQKEFGGSAEAFAQTTAGQIELAKHALGTFGETITGFVLPVLSDMASYAATAFNGIAEGFASGEASSEGFQGVMEAVGVAAADLFGAFGDIAGVVGDLLGPAFGALGPVLGDVLSFFGGIASVIGSVAGWFADLPGPILLGAAALGAWLLLRGPLDAFLTWATLKYLNFGSTVIATGGLAAAASAGLKAVAGGLLAAFGGPVGLAITGITVGLGFLIPALAGGSDATEDIAAATQDYAAALEAANGVIDDSVRKSAAKEASDAGLLRVAKQLGIDLSTVTDAITGQGTALDETRAALEAYIAAETIRTPSKGGVVERLTEQGQAAADALAALESLSGQTGQTITDQNLIAEATGGAASATVLASEEAQAALDEWLKKLQSVAEGFVEPLQIYKDLVQESAQVTADSTEDASDSWSDYVGEVDVSLDELAARLQEQLDNQANWRDNLAQIARWAGADVANALAQMGEDGVDLVAEMADGTTAGAQDMREQILRQLQMGGEEWTAELDNTTKVMAAIGTEGGRKTVQGLAAQLQIGADEVRRIARQYGIDLAEGVNPLLLALGKPAINPAASRPGGAQAAYNADGNVYEDHSAQIAPGGAMRVWAEPETGGESYIPHAAAKRPRALDIWRRTGKILGAPEALYFAGGGFFTDADVPHPYSTAPYGAPLSTAGDAAMDAEYQAATSYVRESGPFGRALAWARSQIGKPYIWGSVGPTGYDCSGFQSAITNVLLGLSPYSRRGSTATFPWPGFAMGDGIYTVGSTPNAGSGIGHMAGTLLGVNVESRGGDGVVVGGSARGAHDGLFGTRAHLATYHGGIGYVPRTGPAILQEGERVIPREMNRLPVGTGTGGGSQVVKVVMPTGMTIQGRVTFDANGIATIAGHVVDQALGQLSDDVAYAGAG